jgi:hypothetical protein
MSVVAPALEASSEVRNTVSQATAAGSLKKKSLSIQVRSRSPSPDQESMIPQQLPQKEIASSQEAAATRKRRRA